MYTNAYTLDGQRGPRIISKRTGTTWEIQINTLGLLILFCPTTYTAHVYGHTRPSPQPTYTTASIYTPNLNPMSLSTNIDKSLILRHFETCVQLPSFYVPFPKLAQLFIPSYNPCRLCSLHCTVTFPSDRRATCPRRAHAAARHVSET